MEVFVEFGDPVPMLDRSLVDYVETWLWEGVFQPPVPFEGLAKSFRANAHHPSAVYCKRNILLSTCVLEKPAVLSFETLERAVQDFLVFGNMFLQLVRNRLGQVVAVRHLPAMFMRRMEQPGRYCYFRHGEVVSEFRAGEVAHVMEPDMTQEVYGVPEYFGALSSVWLNEDATLFRRKYYINGAHTGFLLYMNNPALTEDMERAVREKLESARGLGNFRNLFINGRGRDKSPPQVIPIGEIHARDEFLNIKNVSRDDILAAHRIPPSLMGIVPNNVGGFGDVEKAARVFARNEIRPLQRKLDQINHLCDRRLLSFSEYELAQAGASDTASGQAG